MNNKLVLVLLVFGGGVLGGLVARVLPALASHNNVVDTFDLVPFRGRLEKGELPHSSAVAMTFSIYDAPADGNLLYVEDVVVQPDPDGNFAVVLGRNGHAADGTTKKTLREALRGGNTYYVGVAVAGVALEGRQRLLAAPFAARVADIREADIADDAVLARHIAASQIGSVHLADGGVRGQHVADGVIEPRHLSPCRPGFFSIADGRICMEEVNRGQQAGWGAIENCQLTSPGCRVCMHNDWQQACGAYPGPPASPRPFIGNGRGGAPSGWYGDLGNADDTLHTWNGDNCGANNTGPILPSYGTPDVRPYRCCY